MENNPYTSPTANLFGSSSASSAEGVSQEAIVQLQRTKPWVRFIGVLLWIGVALMMLGGVIVLFSSIMGLSAMNQNGAGNLGLQAGMMVGIAISYLIMSLLYIYPAVKIWKYGSYIGKLVSSRSPEDLVSALDQQRSFWKFFGIMAIIVICMYLLIFIGAIVFGAAAASGLQTLHLGPQSMIFWRVL